MAWTPLLCAEQLDDLYSLFMEIERAPGWLYERDAPRSRSWLALALLHRRLAALARAMDILQTKRIGVQIALIDGEVEDLTGELEKMHRETQAEARRWCDRGPAPERRDRTLYLERRCRAIDGAIKELESLS